MRQHSTVSQMQPSYSSADPAGSQTSLVPSPHLRLQLPCAALLAKAIGGDWKAGRGDNGLSDSAEDITGELRATNILCSSKKSSNCRLIDTLGCVESTTLHAMLQLHHCMLHAYAYLQVTVPAS